MSYRRYSHCLTPSPLLSQLVRGGGPTTNKSCIVCLCSVSMLPLVKKYLHLKRRHKHVDSSEMLSKLTGSLVEIQRLVGGRYVRMWRRQTLSWTCFCESEKNKTKHSLRENTTTQRARLHLIIKIELLRHEHLLILSCMLTWRSYTSADSWCCLRRCREWLWRKELEITSCLTFFVLSLCVSLQVCGVSFPVFISVSMQHPFNSSCAQSRLCGHEIQELNKYNYGRKYTLW